MNPRINLLTQPKALQPMLRRALADVSDLLHYRVVARQEREGSMEIDSLILRVGNHMPIAHIRTRKVLR